MRKTVICFIYIVALFAGIASAQDAHHSQYFNLSPYYNPAATGHDVEHIRLTGMYRRQWPSIATPFTTQSIVFDKQVSKVGFGALLNKNSAGDGSITRIQLGGMISYRLQFNDHKIASGISIGFIQKSFDPGKMTFDDQYNDDAGYDPANPTSEQFAFTKVVRPDFSAGFLYSYGDIQKTRWVPYAGFSMMHLNQPDEVLIEQSNINPMKTSVQGGTRFSVNEKVEVDPSVMMSWQQFSNEMLYGVKTAYKFDTRTKVEGGIYIRNKDAAIAYAGYQWNSLMVGITYDASLSKATTGPGAFELSLTYIPKAKPKKEKKPVAEKTEAPKKTTPVKNSEEKKTVESRSTDKKVVKPEEKKAEVKKPAEKTPAKTTEKKQETKKAVSEKSNKKDSKEVAKTVKKSEAVTPIEKKPVKESVTNQPEPAKEVVTIDKDADGVPDVSDLCPDKNGSPAANGCPDADNDGIADASDKCPNEKGSINKEGCPELRMPQSTDRTVYFDEYSAVVHPFDVIDILEPVSDTLFFDSNLKLVISGYSYEEGDSASCKLLSDNRAESVRDFFINKGIPADKIEMASYGNTKATVPTAPATSRQNRKVEIYIVRK